MKKIFPSLIIMLLFAAVAKGQSVKEVQDSIIYYTRNIDKWGTLLSDTSYDYAYDSLEFYNKRLLDYLNDACKNNPATLKANFKFPKYCGVNILTSDDNKFRIYCWNVGGGGTARSYNALAQYKIDDKVGTYVLNDVSKMVEGDVCSGFFYEELYTIKTRDNHNVYLTVDYSQAATTLLGHTITAFTLRNGKLICNFPFFKTSSKTLGSIGFGCDLSNAVNQNNNVADFPNIKISKDKQKIYVPLIKESGAVTSKYLVYVFDSNNYVFDKNAK